MEPLQVMHGRLRDAEVNAFAVMKDEMFYIRAFLDHHRRIGVEQFLILDDRSTDGTREFLAGQPDCVVLASPYTFGETVTMPTDNGSRSVRGAVAFKTMIPRKYLSGRYALCLDTDEFAILPVGVRNLRELQEILARNDVVSVAATLIDFFPRSVLEMDEPRDPPSAEEMLRLHGYFDALPLLGWQPGREHPVRLEESATARLFRKHRIKTVPEAMQGAPRWLNRLLPYRIPTTSVSKMPLVRWVDGVTYENTHRTNVVPSDKVLLGLAHVKFTYDLSRRMAAALESKAYVRGSRKYLWYEELLESMRQGDPSFLGPDTRLYTQPADLAEARLTKLELA